MHYYYIHSWVQKESELAADITSSAALVRAIENLCNVHCGSNFLPMLFQHDLRGVKYDRVDSNVLRIRSRRVQV